jgi:hypothetical protein
MTTLKKLKHTQERYKSELYELHLYEPSPEYYKMRREELEYNIAVIEDAIDIEKKMIPMKIMLYSFVVIAISLLIWGIFSE